MKLLAAVLFALALPASATASYDWLPVFERAAVQHWGRGALPPCGQPRVVWTDLDGEAVAQVPRNQDGTYTCAMEIDSERWRGYDTADRCRIVAHEYGHLYGRQHVAGTVMAETVSGVRYWPCDRLMKRVMWCRKRQGCLVITVPRRANIAKLNESR